MPERTPASSPAAATRRNTPHGTGRAPAALRGLRRTARTLLAAGAVLAAVTAGLTAAPGPASA
ncbi:MAG: hypothetical protein FWE75_24970, partial [Actinomycetia bacterium]|nr:hypothetical protein [Actinomycetes bacterium]